VRIGILGAVFVMVAVAGGPQPRFTYTPAVVQPGQSISVTASHFSASSTAAILVLTNDVGQARVLGAVPIVSGGFSAQFTIPANLAAGSYLVGVADQSLRGAANQTGTLSVAPSSGPWAHALRSDRVSGEEKRTIARTLPIGRSHLSPTNL